MKDSISRRQFIRRSLAGTALAALPHARVLGANQDIRLGVRRPLFAADSPILATLLPMLEQLDPLRARALLTSLQKLELVHREGVVVVMPETLVFQ